MSIAKAPATTDAHSQERAQASEVIPLVDLRAQHHSLEDELGLAFRRVVADCDFILGSAVGEFESAFAQWLGVEHAIGVGNGLDALTLALLALQVGPGDEVIVPANTFIATALAVSRIGARPVLVDCDPSTFNIDVAQIEGAITPRTRAVIPVHLTGQPAEMDPILAIAARHGLHVVEDAAQAHGATYHARPCGTLGKVGCFSFYPGKNLGALGDAGLVCSNDPGIAQKVSWLRNYGQREKYIHVLQGVNSRMDTLQAAVLGIKLPRL
ncbi:MAG TPA: DegT/DnrJ/EryC1/StrS family aminotransferase, partial [Planctomycetaceae bacterium]|nr:DegT/DnrJ/EryC1/StrS family aminotransferase [Planctomycetaceae bacterium]